MAKVKMLENRETGVRFLHSEELAKYDHLHEVWVDSDAPEPVKTKPNPGNKFPDFKLYDDATTKRMMADFAHEKFGVDLAYDKLTKDQMIAQIETLLEEYETPPADEATE